MVPGLDPRFAEPLARRTQQNHLQIAAMNRELRPGISRRQPARLAPDFLPELVEVDELVCCHGTIGQRIKETALAEHPARMRKQIDADPERTQFLDRFIDTRLDANAVELERSGEPRDAGADDDHVHNRPASELPLAFPSL